MEQLKNTNSLSQNQSQQDLITFCKFCKRKMKNPDSIERGFGSCCGKKNNLIEIRRKQSHSIMEYI